jgi:transposase
VTPELEKEMVVGILSVFFTALFTGIPAVLLVWWTWKRDQEQLVVQKFVNRWDTIAGGKVLEKGLQDQSRAPHHLPQKSSAQIQHHVLALRGELTTFGAARLKRQFDLSISHMAIQRIWRQHGLLKKRRRKYQHRQAPGHLNAQ